MAIINLTSTQENGILFVTWAGLNGADTGQPFANAAMFADKTVQIFGTFDSKTVTLEGSNDPRVLSDPSNAVWFTLTDPSSTAISKTSAAGEGVLENPRFIRPSVSGPAGSASITVILAAKGS